MFRIPIDDDGGKQVQLGHTLVLALSGAVPDFTLATDPQGVFQGVMGLALVQPDLSTTLHIRTEQPFNDEQCPLDFAHFTKGKGQLMLARIRSDFFQQVAGWHDSCGPGCHGPQYVGPVLDNQALPDFAANQAAQFCRGCRRIEYIKPF